MKIKKTHIEKKPYEFQFQIPQISKEHFSIEICSDVCLFCEGKIEQTIEDQFLLTGKYQTSFTTICHCCLSDFTRQSKQNFQISLVPQAIFEKQVANGDSLNVDCYQTEEIVLDGYFQTQFLIDIPFVIKCQKNCKGICSRCGINLNKKSCLCSKVTAPNAFATYFQNKKQ
jgi:uncharacterized protein